MFTGIIEKSVRVLGVADSPKFRRITLASHWDDLKGGESIAINGVCLTVAEISAGEIGFDVIAETLAKTNLGLLKAGDAVHVERALRVGDRLDGHFVQGHVDGVALLDRRIDDETETRLRFNTPRDLARYLIPKGSVTIDGVSLTIASIEGNFFEVALIPTTLLKTALGDRSNDWSYNLEMDILSKTIIAHLERMKPGGA